MSKWTPIVLGRRVWAAVRYLLRRWCLGVGAGPSRRVAAKGFSPEAYRARQIMPKRPADAARMGTRLPVRERLGPVIKRLHGEGVIENIGAGRANKWRLKSLD